MKEPGRLNIIVSMSHYSSAVLWCTFSNGKLASL